MLRAFIESDPTTCPNGEAILAHAKARGLTDAILAREPAFGWHLASKTAEGGVIGDICEELNILSGGGCQHWHQIDPDAFEEPEQRQACIIAALPQLQRAKGCEFRVHTDAGHPVDGEGLWSLMTVDAENEESLTAFIKAAERKFWAVWIRGTNMEKSSSARYGRWHGKPGAVLFKPTDARGPWQDGFQPSHAA